jgi:transposase-like protein
MHVLQIEERVKKTKEEEARWEAQLAGAGATSASDTTKCPQCKGSQAVAQVVLSGGTYAQERVPICRYVCQDCSHTWRVD